MPNPLSPQKALIFRITHRDNIPWILENGLHCRNSNRLDPNFVSIGNETLIHDRQQVVVPIAPGGTLSDYVPFYFTPHSVMLFNVKTGYHGIRQRRNDEIVFLVSSLHRLTQDNVRFVFTDRHARLDFVDFYSDMGELTRINWRILQNRDFRRDNNDLGKLERYQAEALVHRHLPMTSILGIVCYNTRERDRVGQLAEKTELSLDMISRPGWYF
jgi:hypothetical protein